MMPKDFNNFLDPFKTMDCYIATFLFNRRMNIANNVVYFFHSKNIEKMREKLNAFNDDDYILDFFFPYSDFQEFEKENDVRNFHVIYYEKE